MRGTLECSRKMLELEKQKLTVQEKSLILSYCEGKLSPNKKDPFQEVYITPNPKGFKEMLASSNLEDLRFFSG